MSANALLRSTAQLDIAARRVPQKTVNATTRLLTAVARHREGADFVTDMLNVLSQVAATIEAEDLAATGSGYAALVRFLEQPDVLDALRETDPLMPAKLRGYRMRERLLAAEGGVCSTRELAETLGITRQAVDKRRKSGNLIGMQLGKRGYVYPVWQVDLAGLSDVLAELRDYDPWTQLAFMLAPNRWLGDESPLDVLRRGEISRAVEAARLYGDQIAA